MLLVVLGDRGDDRDERPDDVGRVEPPAHAHFEDGDVDLELGELDEGQGGHDLEIGRVVDELAVGHLAVDDGLERRQPFAEAPFRDDHPVDAYALLDSG